MTTLYVYSGTGNSLWVARKLALEMGSSDIRPMSISTDHPIECGSDVIGIVFPVHMWGVPRRVLGWINRLKPIDGTYYFAVAVNAGQVAATLLQAARVMSGRGITLSSGFSVTMPSNYLPWNTTAPIEKQQRLFLDASVRIAAIASAVKDRRVLAMEKGPLWQNIVFTWLYRLAFSQVPHLDDRFWADGNCDGCSLCARICPAQNIQMQKEKPKWLNHCEQCLACIQWCPKASIQYGKKTVAYERYHHPEIKPGDLIKMVT